jgi:hypothetical protein
MSWQPPPAWEYAGSIHFHTNLSDGRSSPAATACAAQSAKLDFVILTDHNTRQAALATPDWTGEGWQGSVLYLVGSEISPAGEHNHYLALGAGPFPHRASPQMCIDAVTAAGGLSFLAHPHDRGSIFLGLPAHSWMDWTVDNYQGIEIWNFFSGWVSQATSAWRTIRAVLAPRWTFTGPCPETLALWDTACQERKVVGIGGSDAHGVQIKLFGVTVIDASYEFSFQTVRTYVLLPAPLPKDALAARIAILNGIGQGSCFVADYGQGDPRGFRFWALTHNGLCISMGEEDRWPGPLTFQITTPTRAKIRLCRDGQPVSVTVSNRLAATHSQAGVYRVEVFRRHAGAWRPWIFSNPIYWRNST